MACNKELLGHIPTVMPDSFRALSLAELPRALNTMPLDGNDRVAYADLSGARGVPALRNVSLHFQKHAALGTKNIYAILFGHRGSGKTTELNRIAEHLTKGFHPVILTIDKSLERDVDYSHLLLFLVDDLAKWARNAGLPVDQSLYDEVAQWFADRFLTVEEIQRFEAEISAEASAGASVNYFGLKASLIARIKSMITGSTERRVEFKQKLQDYTSDLRDRTNRFLRHIREICKKEGHPSRLLLIQDNLDRLDAESARRLFIDHGDLLRQLDADILWTAPVGVTMAPHRIENVFPDAFRMPIPAVFLQNGEENLVAIAGLLDLVNRRAEIQTVFESEGVARHLVLHCGGSVRDLIRLLSHAWLDAATRDQIVLDMASAKAAVKKLCINFQEALMPGSLYYPLLAEVAETKAEPGGLGDNPSDEQVRSRYQNFREMLSNGAIFQYNGDTIWYDVHPAVRDIPRFKETLEKLRHARDSSTSIL
jgi:hypothetical protein